MRISNGDCSKQAKCASLLLVLAHKKKRILKKLHLTAKEPQQCYFKITFNFLDVASFS